MAQNQKGTGNAMEIDRLATQLAKDPQSKAFMPLAEEYGKVGMWQEAAGVLEDGLKFYPGFITAMVALGRAYDHMGQSMKAKAILEESVKLSPENLRAHRTLIKIYQSQGLNDSALQSCAIILSVNSRDEEALSVQSALGGPLKQSKKEERAKPIASVSRNSSAMKMTALSDPAELTPSSSASNIAPTDPRVMETEPIVTPHNKESQVGEQVMDSEPNPHATETVEILPPSPHAEVVAQLESWLQSIELHRHDRGTTNQPRSNVS